MKETDDNSAKGGSRDGGGGGGDESAYLTWRHCDRVKKCMKAERSKRVQKILSSLTLGEET